MTFWVDRQKVKRKNYKQLQMIKGTWVLTWKWGFIGAVTDDASDTQGKKKSNPMYTGSTNNSSISQICVQIRQQSSVAQKMQDSPVIQKYNIKETVKHAIYSFNKKKREKRSVWLFQNI